MEDCDMNLKESTAMIYRDRKLSSNEKKSMNGNDDAKAICLDRVGLEDRIVLHETPKDGFWRMFAVRS